MKKTRLFAALLAVCLMMSGSALAWTVEDVDWEDVTVNVDSPNINQPSAWAKTEVEAAIAAGLVPELTGNPGFQDEITREQFAELVVRTMDVIHGGDTFSPEAVEKMHFSDCDNPSVLMAASAGVVDGVGNGKFDPKATTNREQIATMVNRAVNSLNGMSSGGVLSLKPGSVESFSDKASISSWAREGVGTLAANGILQGSGGKAMPKDSCTVEQSILLCYRVYQKSAVA